MQSRFPVHDGNLVPPGGVNDIQKPPYGWRSVHKKERLEMKKVNKHILFLFLIIALLVISTSVVFAKELGLLTISGPGIKGEVTFKDPEAMMDLEKSGF